MTSKPLKHGSELRLIADRLFGRQEVSEAPSEKHWCLSAVDKYGDKSKGPWRKYAADKDWECDLCTEDPYLSEYGSTYLLSPAGAFAIIEAMKASQRFSTRHDFTQAIWGCMPTTDDNLRIAWPYAVLFMTPEIVALAAYEALQ